MVYVDSSKPDMVEGFTRNTFTAMIEGVRNGAIEAGLIDPAAFDDGVRGLSNRRNGRRFLLYIF